MVHRSVVKERRLTCAETVRTNKYIADKRVNIFKQFVPRSVRFVSFPLSADALGRDRTYLVT